MGDWPPGFQTDLEGALPGKVRYRAVDRIAYSRDAYPMARAPLAVVQARSTEDVSTAVALCHRYSVPFTSRGAGTALTGATIPSERGIVIALAAMDRIRQIDPVGRFAWVEPGVVNLELSRRASAFGLRFAPDPSSQSASTIGGNISTNAGGPHCLKYGTTTDHVLGLEFVLPDGEVTLIGGPGAVRSGPSILSLLVGSEGTLGVVTAACVRLIPLPTEIRTLVVGYSSLEAAAETVSSTIAAGIVPAALELIDRPIIQAIEDFSPCGYPREAAAVLLIELEGEAHLVEAHAAAVREIVSAQPALMLEEAADPDHRERLWKGRRSAFGTMARIAPNYYLHDCVVPRSRLVEVVTKLQAAATAKGVFLSNVMHAGDGNLHPVLLFDRNDPGMVERVAEVGEQILRICLDAGGVLTGEHGIGLEKRGMMPAAFSEDDLELMRRAKLAFDPQQISNPDKILPEPGGCREPLAHTAFDVAAVAGSGLWI